MYTGPQETGRYDHGLVFLHWANRDTPTFFTGPITIPLSKG